MQQKTVICILAIFLIQLTGCKEKRARTDQLPQPGKSAEMPQGDLVGEADPMANPEAVPGGTLLSWAASFPKSLNMFLDYNSTSIDICDGLFEPLAEFHSKDHRMTGVLAQSWTRSEDDLTFDFKLHEKAAWSDGRPVAARDVQFYYDVVMNPDNMTPLFRVSLAKFHRPEVLDDKTVRIKAKKGHWRNFINACQFFALPAHAMEGLDFNKMNFSFPVTSGPYRLKEVKKNRYVLMQRRSDWWGRIKHYNRFKYNFQTIKHKFISEPTKALEAFKKGELDLLSIGSATTWFKKTGFEAIEKGWVVKQKVYNKEPMGYQGFAINLRKAKFQDVRVRKALCLLLNRKKINEKFMFNLYTLSNSYYSDLYPNYQNPDAPLFQYNPHRARALLKEAGWLVNADGLLEKDGKRFSITFMTASEDLRHTNVYVEDLKAVGIGAKIEKLSWSTIRKRLHKFDFDMYWISWGSYRGRDPESGYSSKEAAREASNNVSGVADAILDSLIEVQKTVSDLNKRVAMLKAVDTRLSQILPYVLLWQAEFKRLIYWNKFGTPEFVLAKFRDVSESAFRYWWVDPNKAKELNEAVKAGRPLPLQQAEVRYKE